MTSLREARMTGVARVDTLKGSTIITTKKGSIKSPREASMSRISLISLIYPLILVSIEKKEF